MHYISISIADNPATPTHAFQHFCLHNFSTKGFANTNRKFRNEITMPVYRRLVGNATIRQSAFIFHIFTVFDI